MLVALVFLVGVVPAAYGAGCQYWITPVPPKGSPPQPGKMEYYSCTGVFTMDNCVDVTCTEAGYAEKGCTPIDEAAYNCLVAKERPESYGYLIKNPSACPGFTPVIPKVTGTKGKQPSVKPPTTVVTVPEGDKTAPEVPGEKTGVPDTKVPEKTKPEIQPPYRRRLLRKRI